MLGLKCGSVKCKARNLNPVLYSLVFLHFILNMMLSSQAGHGEEGYESIAGGKVALAKGGALLL